MIAAMKQTSFAFDKSTDNLLKTIKIDEIYAFMFNPASLLFGPFVTFQQFKKSLNRSINGNFMVSYII